MKRQPPDQEKIFANNATNKGLISKIYKQCIQLNIKQPSHKWAEDLYRHYSKEDIQMANRHMTSYSILLSIREIQIKTRISSHWSEWPSLKTLQIQVYSNLKKKKNCRNSKYWRGCREKGALLHCQWESKLEQPLKRTLWRFLTKLTIELHVILQSHSWAYIQKKICLQKAHAPQYSM